ncbi:MAG TPA: hypothetical protein PLU87_00075 [Sedimentisphaerales bacterium]|nr:hypothetical protein [Sedimentisphaerales bacterium]HRS13096.1 hypothetical protein [Sedimentisphaerales bacterium]HRV46408.1 hypothetical protein [Sedimentisphaerales bacterium]
MTDRDVPRRFQRLYRLAMTGRSQSAAIRSLCLECMAYVANAVRDCTDTGCPLFAYRLTGRKTPTAVETTHSVAPTRIRVRFATELATIWPGPDPRAVSVNWNAQKARGELCGPLWSGSHAVRYVSHGAGWFCEGQGKVGFTGGGRARTPAKGWWLHA